MSQASGVCTKRVQTPNRQIYASIIQVVIHIVKKMLKGEDIFQ